MKNPCVKQNMWILGAKHKCRDPMNYDGILKARKKHVNQNVSGRDIF